MDPLTHGMIGLAAYTLFQTPSLENPVFLGGILGAIAPDFDIITRIKGDYVYLKHHRVASHSLMAMVPISVIIAFGLKLMFSNLPLVPTLVWTLVGVISHVFFDLLNSYGVALLYPYSRKKYSLNLITIYDPLLLLLCGYIFFFNRGSIYEKMTLSLILTIYLVSKLMIRKKLTQKVLMSYSIEKENATICLMPAEYNPIGWDYLIMTKNTWIVGDIGYRGIAKTRDMLERVKHPIIEKSFKEELGKYFIEFTPFFHATIFEDEEGLTVKYTDLRYRVKGGFKHHGLLAYNRNKQLINSSFHPFDVKNKIALADNKNNL